MKNPAFQFYPGDWMKDPQLRAVSSACRGLWIDMLCLMWESARRGFLVHPTGRAVTTEQLARMTGNSADDTAGMLQELEDCGVCSRTGDGILYSRRLERDERIRQVRSDAGKLGGNPSLLKQNPNHGVKQRDNLRVNLEVFQKEGSSSSSTPSGGGARAHTHEELEPPSREEPSADAEIPTESEVVTHGERAGVPPPYCREYHAKTTERHRWISGGKLIDWKRQLVRHWHEYGQEWRSRQSQHSGQNGHSITPVRRKLPPPPTPPPEFLQ